ncbi:MAG: hypothetical protein M3499_07755 [Actinomycetota bacterium]|nr:hypothetical protein [Actinomycetota bacterium]
MTRTAMRLERAEVDFATNFAVEGRAHVLRIAEFENVGELFDFRAGRVHVTLETLFEEEEQWTPLRKFELVIDASAGATIMSSYITYDNREMLPS